MRRIGMLVALATTIATEACIHRHREWPPRNTHKIISFSTEKRVAVAAFVRAGIQSFDSTAVVCLRIENEEDAPYSYDPDRALIQEIKIPQRVVASRNCPRIYGHEAWLVGTPPPPKPPPGYVNPLSVFVGDLHFKGKQASAVVTVDMPGVRYSHYCTAVRIGHHDWKVMCPHGTYQILG